MKHQTTSFLLAITLVVSLAACSGGGDDADTNPQPPVASLLVNAGSNITLDENTTSTLVAGSNGGTSPITYTWQVSSAQAQINHPDTSVPDAEITALSTVAVTNVTVTLIATDSLGNTNSDTFTLTINPINAPPTANITVSQAEGYAVNAFPGNASIVLDGSTSTDADPQTNNAAITSYLWQQIAGPNLLAGINTSAASITLSAPVISLTESAIFRLTVTDQEQASATSEVVLSLLAQSSTILNASIDSIPSVFSGELMALSATATSAAQNAAPFNAAWSNNGSAQIIETNAFNTAAVAPLVAQNTTIDFDLLAGDNFNNQTNARAQSLVLAPVSRVFNDTGMIMFAGVGGLTNNYQADFAGQDADYGSDRQTASGQIVKVGEGEQGFDFSRLDNNGDIVDATAASSSANFSCVRDNISGLVWQVKTASDSSDINYVGQTFTWFQEENNGNFAGELNANATSCNVSSNQCNTAAYVAQINTQGLCGFFDWRLPTPNELQSILHYGKTNPPMVDETFFPVWDTNNVSATQSLWHWTNQTSADGVSGDVARNAWAYDINTGNDGFVNKAFAQYVILVRAGR